MSVIDIGGKVREGEGLDAVAVENLLKQQGIDLHGQVALTHCSRRASNWT